LVLGGTLDVTIVFDAYTRIVVGRGGESRRPHELGAAQDVRATTGESRPLVDSIGR